MTRDQIETHLTLQGWVPMKLTGSKPRLVNIGLPANVNWLYNDRADVHPAWSPCSGWVECEWGVLRDERVFEAYKALSRKGLV